jgi:diguanylate cyclase (GGDEF)-like protein
MGLTMKNRMRGKDVATKMVNVGEYELQKSLVTEIIESSPEGILVVDENGIIVSHNRRFVEIWQIPSHKLQGNNAGNSAIGADDNPILAHNVGCVKDKQAFLARIRELYANPHMDDHCEIELMDGRTLERHSTVLRNENSQYLGRVWFFRDITSQKQTENDLMELAHHDSLTGVANRRYFFDWAGQEFSRSKRHSTQLSIAELDIDHFKKINDQYGHAAGDGVLISLCNTSKRLVRDTNIFARIGGEEFALLLPDTNLDGAVSLAERLRRVIADNTLTLDGVEIRCTVSIGVASLKPTDTCIEDTILRADMALYNAKANGRNRVEIKE